MGTPFIVITDNTGEKPKSFITWGKYRISETYESQEKALNGLIEEQWEIMITCMGILLATDREMRDEKIEKYIEEYKPDFGEIKDKIKE